MSTKLGIIGGTGAANLALFRKWRYTSIPTIYGEVVAAQGEISGLPAVFLPRHGPQHAVPPHLINYRANIAALKKLDVASAMAICAVGSLDADLQPGALAVLSDFIDYTSRRTCTFFVGGPEGVVHTDFSRPYCPTVAQAMTRAGGAVGLKTPEKCVYICVEGPRYETPAEIRMFRQWGADVVGMTNVPEATLAREAGICYAALAAVTNFAAGVSPARLSHDEVVAAMRAMDGPVSEIISGAAGLIGAGEECRSCSTMEITS